MSIFTRFNFGYNKPEQHEPLTLTTGRRQQLIDKAMTGASVNEQLTLVYHAFSKLSQTERNNMIRQLDRDMWKELKV